MTPGSDFSSGFATSIGCWRKGFTSITPRAVVISRVASTVCPETVARQRRTCEPAAGVQPGKPVKT